MNYKVISTTSEKTKANPTYMDVIRYLNSSKGPKLDLDRIASLLGLGQLPKIMSLMMENVSVSMFPGISSSLSSAQEAKLNTILTSAALLIGKIMQNRVMTHEGMTEQVIAASFKLTAFLSSGDWKIVHQQDEDGKWIGITLRHDGQRPNTKLPADVASELEVFLYRLISQEDATGFVSIMTTPDSKEKGKVVEMSIQANIGHEDFFGYGDNVMLMKMPQTVRNDSVKLKPIMASNYF
jgi:hypothetical protein